MKPKSCRTTATPKSRGISEGQQVFWESALGRIACEITRLTYDETHRCWNALVVLTEDLQWHRAGKPLADHIEKIRLTREGP